MFSVLLSLGALVGLVWVALRATGKDQASYLVDAGLWVLLGSFLGGRLAYIFINWAYYQTHLLEIPQLWLGGLSGPGALAGGLFALAVVAAVAQSAPAELGASLLPLALSLSVTAWLGCWLEGVAYGAPTSAWWAAPSLDEWGILQDRVPLQLIAALLSLLSFAVLDLLSQPARRTSWRKLWSQLTVYRRKLVMGKTTTPLPLKKPDPRPKHIQMSEQILANRASALPAAHVTALGLLIMGLEIYAVSVMRLDPGQIWHGQRYETWAGLAFIALAITSLLASLFMGWRRSAHKAALRRSAL